MQLLESSGRQVQDSYDDLYRLTQEAISDPLAGNKTFDYTYDAVGNRLSKAEDGAVTTYAYDANDRLLSTAGAEVSNFT